MDNPEEQISRWQIFLIFLRLGLTSFGGPVAHLGYFHHEFVERRRWLKEEAYADLVALCQFLPGPASSQVGMGIGLSRAGLRGAVAAWAGFTLPSAFILMLFAYGVGASAPSVMSGGWLQGLKIAAVAVVAQALVGMARQLCPDFARRLLALCAALIAFILPGISGQLIALFLTAICGWLFLPSVSTVSDHLQLFAGSHKQAVVSNLLFVLLLFGLPFVVAGEHYLELVDSFFRAGALVFGGGHVVLPLLQAEVVEKGWLSKDLFLAGYGAAQAVPGPLFTFSAYLGAAMGSGYGRMVSGLVCLLAIFLPSLLLLIGILPYWERLRRYAVVRRSLLGVNAGVVGLLAAAFIDPVLTSGIHGFFDLLLAVVAFWLLYFRRLPAWLVVLCCGIAGAIPG